jgi:hypothetical protein
MPLRDSVIAKNILGQYRHPEFSLAERKIEATRGHDREIAGKAGHNETYIRSSSFRRVFGQKSIMLSAPGALLEGPHGSWPTPSIAT